MDIINTIMNLDIDSNNTQEIVELCAAADWSALYDQYKDSDDYYSIGDILEALYWYANDCHEGQGSLEYQMLSAVSEVFTPSPSATGCEDDSNSAGIYDSLVRASNPS